MTQQRKSKNWLEWCVFGGGLILVVATVGYLIYEAVTAPQGPPLIELKLGEPRQQASGFAVPVTASTGATRPRRPFISKSSW